ncbi:DUF397 domain-containing protein [Amycolatopsis roodepoortensis]|uniref:DUF397 domain-containing protein n=1 Tax=Amycolatopsis roodepoortensis TaxID=700274 RepID=UPI00214CD72A|nr:DUF397 domain-containing protein [Amycolatopsis roodepoortensis]UUV34363.1 DUF397 domain-containing protein [Amycolatopsis roodepoortensis]
MTQDTPHDTMTGWHKSTYTHWEENACVEVGAGGDKVGIRDTKQWAIPNQDRPVLVLDAAAFGGLLDHLKASQP